MSILIFNSKKVDADGIVENFWVKISGTTIEAIGTGSPATVDAETVIDANGLWLAPGFVDIHCHGGAGHSFGDEAEHISAALQPHRLGGTTRSVISLVSESVDTLSRSLHSIAKVSRDDSCVLGSHIEGPYLASDFRGAHSAGALATPQQSDLEALLEAANGTLVQATVAPELEAADTAIGMFLDSGVRVALGHSGASYQQAQRAFDQGVSILTHAFNAMKPIHHREPGPLLAAFEDERVTVELILDGLHVAIPVARMLLREAAGRVALVTDAMAATGCGDGEYRLGALEVEVSQGKALVKGTETLAGSTLTQDVALRHAIQEVGLPPTEAIAALTITPSRALGFDETIGLLRPGFVADVVLLSSSWTVERVWADGKLVL